MKNFLAIVFVFVIGYSSFIYALNSGEKQIGGIKTSDTWENVNYVNGTNLTYQELLDQNLIENGDFSLDINSNNIPDGFYVSNSDNYTLENGIFTYESNTDWAFIYTYNVLLENHKYYISLDFITTQPTRLDIKNSSNVILDLFIVDNYNGKISTIFENISYSTQFRLVSYTQNIFNHIVSYDNIMLYDLTAIYGSGNEPTLEEFETELNRYNNNVGIITVSNYDFRTNNPDDIDGGNLGDDSVMGMWYLITNPLKLILSFIAEGAETAWQITSSFVEDTWEEVSGTLKKWNNYLREWLPFIDPQP